FTVTNTNDAGAGSLRQAITDANASAGTTDTIAFNIAGAGVHTIAPTSALPIVTDPVIIDGTTEPDFVATPVVELDGTNAGAAANGLHIAAGNSTVKGLVINRFGVGLAGGNGILVSPNGGNRIEGNFIGTNVAGTAAAANSNDGVSLIDAASNVVTNNVLSGNSDNGLNLDHSNGNTITGNLIGTNASGTGLVPNSVDGVEIGQNTLGNIIGGLTPAERNVISGNRIGILIAGAGNQVRGNFIGTDISGTLDLGNVFDGVLIFGGLNNVVGGTAAGAGNVLSGNGRHGVFITNLGGTAATGNAVQGNFIGTDVSGSSPRGNSINGVHVETTSSNNLIGGTAAGAGNRIAFNGGVGVAVLGAAGNSILSNSIIANGTTAAHLGIDLGADGATANDANDADTGANNLQNFPVLTSATSSGGNTTITGTFNSEASKAYRVEFFSNAACDASGNGEGRTFLGSTTVNTDASGNAAINTTLLTATS
ncbi:MAG: right-handed parallel beta-helix repeat-containing protein, partial [Actinobacteria bacterium]|nr:right-handed parallel beta-helix repeat-containing protein [Actinomycetota bacterium]